MEIPSPLATPRDNSQYKINYSTIIDEALSYIKEQAFYAEFLINICLNSPSLKTSNKIHAISLLSKTIHNQLIPCVPQVYYITFKALKYLTTQNVVEPTLLISIFSYSIEVFYGVDMPFTYYLIQLVNQLARKNKLQLSNRIMQRTTDTEMFVDSNIKMLKTRLSTADLNPDLVKLRDVLSTILNIDSSETPQQPQQQTSNQNEQYFYIVSSSQLKQLYAFVNEYLSYDKQEQQNEFNAFMERAFDKETIKYYYYPLVL